MSPPSPRPKPAPGHSRKPAETPGDHVDLLMTILTEQLDGHERLLSSIERKREAIRSADIDVISALCQEENDIVQRLGDLERGRLELVGVMTERRSPEAARPLSLEEIAADVDPTRRERLETLVERLRAVVRTVRNESSIVATAATALSRHMTGIMQTVHRALSQAGVYERRGRIAVGSQMDFCVDVKS